MSCGRGGAGNINFAEARVQDGNSSLAGLNDLEANVRPGTAYTVTVQAGPSVGEKDDEYIHTGRGGTGNVISQDDVKQRQQSFGHGDDAFTLQTETEVSAGPSGKSSAATTAGGGGTPLKYLGRGGAGNFMPSPWEDGSGDMELQRRRESEVREKVANDVEKGIPRPDRIHDPYRHPFERLLRIVQH